MDAASTRWMVWVCDECGGRYFADQVRAHGGCLGCSNPHGKEYSTDGDKLYPVKK